MIRTVSCLRIQTEHCCSVDCECKCPKAAAYGSFRLKWKEGKEGTGRRGSLSPRFHPISFDLLFFQLKQSSFIRSNGLVLLLVQIITSNLSQHTRRSLIEWSVSERHGTAHSCSPYRAQVKSQERWTPFCSLSVRYDKENSQLQLPPAIWDVKVRWTIDF